MFFVCRADKRAEERRLRTGFNPPERPKSLRAKLYETLEMSVDHRYNIIIVRVAFTIVQQMVVNLELYRPIALTSQILRVEPPDAPKQYLFGCNNHIQRENEPF
jgi:hypothetical protein